MDFNKSVSFLVLMSLTLGNSAWSQGRGGHGQNQGPSRGWGGADNRHYGGGDTGVSRIGTPVFSTGCGKQYAQPAQRDLLNACLQGAQSGLATAQRYATQQGRNDGFKAGYAWGLRAGIDETRNDPTQITAGQAALNTQDSPDLIQKLQLADKSGATQGATAGSSNGDQEAIKRFHDSIDTAPTPSPIVTQNDYNRYNPHYSTPYNDPYVNTVGAVKNEMDELNNPRLNYGNVTFYGDGYDSGIYGNAPQFRPTDFYNQEGRYNYDRKSSVDGKQAFNIFLRSNGFDRSFYNGLGTVQIITGYTNPQIGDTNPGNGGGHGPTIAPTPAPTVAPTPVPTPVPTPQPIYTTYNLKDIYQQAFITAYEQNAPYYYNDAFNDLIDDGTNAGLYLGDQVGSQLAFQSGLVNAYDAQFRQREGAAFLYGTQSMTGYQGAFNAAFNSEFSNYQNNPQIGVDSFKISGTKNDGIISPGEAITASFVIRNYGGVATTLPVTLEGDVSDARISQIPVNARSTLAQNGTITATVDAVSQSNARIVLNVDGKRIPLSQYVTNQLVPGQVNYKADYVNGVVSITLPIENVSSAGSYDAVQLSLTDSTGRSQTVQAGFISAGQAWKVPTNLKGFDPIAMIDGRVSVSVKASLGSAPLASGTVVVAPSADRSGDLARAFEAIANGSDVSLKTEIQNRLFSDIKAEAENRKFAQYDDKHPSQLKTLVNQKLSGTQTAATKEAYTQLANALEAGNFTFKHALIHFGKPENQKWFKKQIDLLRN